MIFAFFIAALWDGITTVLGVATVIEAQGVTGYALAGVGGLVVFAFGIGTKTIFSEGGFIYIVLRILWILSLLFDLYTSFLGNARYLIMQENIRESIGTRMGIDTISNSLDGTQLISVLVLTILVSSSPMVISFLYEDVA
jgi:hypothetical protein